MWMNQLFHCVNYVHAAVISLNVYSVKRVNKNSFFLLSLKKRKNRLEFRLALFRFEAKITQMKRSKKFEAKIRKISEKKRKKRSEIL
jgi:hypothetical protein